jgi:hypothetical protein
MVCCDQAKDTTRENKKRWDRKLIALEIAAARLALVDISGVAFPSM